MRTLAVLGSVAALGLAVAGLGTSAPSQPGLTGKCAKANLDLVSDGAHARNGQPRLPAVVGRQAWTWLRDLRPVFRPGVRGAVAYEVASRLGFTKAEVTWKAVPFVKSYAPGKKTFDFYMAQVSYSPVRAKAVRLLELVLLREPGRGRDQGHGDHEGEAHQGAQARSRSALRSARRATATSRGTSSRPRSRRSTTRTATRSLLSRTSRSTGSWSTSPARATSRASSCRPRPSSAVCPRRERGSASAWCSEGLVARLLRESGAGSDACERDVDQAREEDGLPAARRC